jgi:hypothetical protein
MTTTPESTPEPWSKYGLRTFKNLVKTFAGIFAIGVAIALGLSGYDQLDVGGYIHHERTIDVYMSNDWLVGENRVCSLIESPDAHGNPSGKVVALICPVEGEKREPHNLSVIFKGILDPKNIEGKERSIPDQWTCTRGSDNFNCEAMATPG